MPKKILVIRFSSIGDIVLTTPVPRILKQQLGAEVHFLTKSAFASLVIHNPHVDRVISLQENWDEMIRALQKENYDHIIDLHHNIRTRRVKYALRKPTASFYKLNMEKWLMVRFKINRLPATHIVDRYIAASAHLGVTNDGQGLDLVIPPEHQLDIKKEFGVAAGEYIAIVIGAAHQTKCMTTAQIASLCILLDRPVILLGGKEEMKKADAIVEMANPEKVKSAVGRFNILQSASIVNQSKCIITHDTGMMHIAAALRKPQGVVWGNTIPSFGMFPYYGNSKVKWKNFEVPGLSCRPCTKLGFDHCPKGHFKCMLHQDLKSIAEFTKQISE